MWILYDTIDLLNSVRDEGTLDVSLLTFTESASITNSERAHDQNIYQAVSNFSKPGDHDAIRWNLGSAKSIDTLAVHFLADESDDIGIGLNDSSANAGSGSELKEFTSINKGWNVSTFSSLSKQWVFAYCKTGTVSNWTELLAGTRTTFDFEPDMGISYSAKHGITDSTTPGGRFRSVRRFDPKKVFTLNWTSIDSTFKATLEAMKNSTHGDFHPVLFYDDSNYWYCRMTGLNMTEVAFNRYSTSLTLEEI
jgi:hypothetical protein